MITLPSVRRRSRRHIWYLSAATQPATIAPTARNEPSASVDTPESPWPIVQPSAVTPPKPISMPPTTWLARSSVVVKPSQRKVFVASAMPADPTSMPSTPAMPNVSTRDWSVQ